MLTAASRLPRHRPIIGAGIFVAVDKGKVATRRWIRHRPSHHPALRGHQHQRARWHALLAEMASMVSVGYAYACAYAATLRGSSRGSSAQGPGPGARSATWPWPVVTSFFQELLRVVTASIATTTRTAQPQPPSRRTCATWRASPPSPSSATQQSSACQIVDLPAVLIVTTLTMLLVVRASRSVR